MTSLLSVLGPTMPEIEKVISKQGHSNRIYVAHILGSPKVYVNDPVCNFKGQTMVMQS